MIEINAVQPTKIVADISGVAPNASLNINTDIGENKMMLRLEGTLNHAEYSQDCVLCLYTTKPIKDTEIRFARYVKHKLQNITSSALPNKDENGESIFYRKRRKGWCIYKYNSLDSNPEFHNKLQRIVLLEEVKQPFDVQKDFKNSPIKYKYKYIVEMYSENDGINPLTPESFGACFTKTSSIDPNKAILTINRKKCALIIDEQWLYISLTLEYNHYFNRYFYGLRIY